MIEIPLPTSVPAVRVRFENKLPSLSIGGESKKPFLSRIKTNYIVPDRAERIMESDVFIIQEASSGEIDRITLAIEDFDYEKGLLTIAELLNPAHLAWWSEINNSYLDGYTVGLFPAEAGPRTIEQYKSQPYNEILWVATEWLIYEGDCHLFCIKRHQDGKQWLHVGLINPEEDRFHSGSLITFQLLKRT